MLYSDGIEEACRDSAAESGDEALARCCTQWSSTLDFVDAMDHHVTENHARRVHEEKDDLTLVCLDLHDDSTAEQQAA